MEYNSSMRSSGQASVETMLITSFLVIAVVGTSYTFMPAFQDGVEALGRDVSEILSSGTIGGAGQARSGAGTGTSSPPDGTGSNNDVNEMNGINQEWNGAQKSGNTGDTRAPVNPRGCGNPRLGCI